MNLTEAAQEETNIPEEGGAIHSLRQAGNCDVAHLPELTSEILAEALQHAAASNCIGGEVLKSSGALVRLKNLEGPVWRVPVQSITPNPEQPRSYFDSEKLQVLARTISASGQKDPVKVVPFVDGSAVRLFLIDGERRFRVIREPLKNRTYAT